ncbi:MAG: MFS transporter [Spirochaetales bacterium]|nr:MFS transporter [Spirochaetales bacterium]
MVSILLLVVIYMSFISLGLPDSMLGAAWPMIYPSIGADVSMAGFISMTACIGTVISSLSFSKIARHFSTRAITSVSIFVTSLALFLISKATSIYMMLPISLLLGLGGGCVDSALNNYVSLHYSTGAMSFLHGFWGVGTTIGPILLGILIPLGYTWRTGYVSLSAIQGVILILSLLAFPLWKLKEKENQKEGISEDNTKVVSTKEAIKRNGAVYALLGFFAYCALENTIMVWNATYMVSGGLLESKAASFSSLFFWGMTIGRIITGFVADKYGDAFMNRVGGVVLILAIILTPIVPVEFFWIVLLLLGLGCAPFYPMMMHQTPRLYGVDASPSLIGLQMASAYVGSTLAPPVFGFISKYLGMWIFPLYIFLFFILLVFSTEKKRSLLSSLGLLK